MAHNDQQRPQRRKGSGCTRHQTRTCLTLAVWLLIAVLFPAFQPSASTVCAHAENALPGEEPPHYEDIGWWDDVYPQWVDGLTPIENYDWYGFVNTSGQVVIPAVWEDVGNFGSGLAPVLNADGLWGYVNTDGELVIPCVWDNAAAFCEERAAVAKDGLWGFIDPAGELVIPCQWKDVGDFSEGMAAVPDPSFEDEERWFDPPTGYINTQGQLVIPYQWHFTTDFHDGLAGVRMHTDDGDLHGYINKQGELAIPCVWEDAYEFLDGYAEVCDGHGWGLINTAGELVIPCKWPHLLYSADGLLIVKDADGNWGVINTDGEEIIPCQWYACRYRNGLVRVDDGFQVGMMNLEGELVIPLQWVDAISLGDGLVAIQENNAGWGCMNVQGETLLPCIYSRIYYADGHIIALRQGQVYAFEQQGNPVE